VAHTQYCLLNIFFATEIHIEMC